MYHSQSDLFKRPTKRGLKKKEKKKKYKLSFLKWKSFYFLFLLVWRNKIIEFTVSFHCNLLVFHLTFLLKMASPMSLPFARPAFICLVTEPQNASHLFFIFIFYFYAAIVKLSSANTWSPTVILRVLLPSLNTST